MKVSIITATYNSQYTIQDTLISVASQDYDKIEHIIIDGKSSDETLSIVKTFNHVSKIISENDKGIYDAMNKGLSLATGDVIAILNSDDFYTNDSVISRVVDKFLKNNVDSVYGDLQYVDEIRKHKIIRKWIAKDFKKSKFLYGWMPPHPSFFVRKKIYDKFGVFDLRLKSAADYELMLRLLYKQNVSTSYINQTLVSMRTGGQSNQSLANRIKANREDRKAWEINNLKPKFYTIFLKPMRKITQYI